MVMDFKAAEDYWFGKSKSQEPPPEPSSYPFEPIDPFGPHPVLQEPHLEGPEHFGPPEEFINPFEEPASGEQDKNQSSEESSGPEGQD